MQCFNPRGNGYSTVSMCTRHFPERLYFHNHPQSVYCFHFIFLKNHRLQAVVLLLCSHLGLLLEGPGFLSPLHFLSLTPQPLPTSQHTCSDRDSVDSCISIPLPSYYVNQTVANFPISVPRSRDSRDLNRRVLA